MVTNIIELKAEEQMIAAVEQHPNVRDILNMVLYAFGKWEISRDSVWTKIMCS